MAHMPSARMTDQDPESAQYAPSRGYFTALESARERHPLIAASTSSPLEIAGVLSLDDIAYLSDDGLSGYVVKASGELVGVFSSVKGRGDALMVSAIANGARRLDCFDGYLPELYARHGFRETDRAENWTPGGPDVVYMARV